MVHGAVRLEAHMNKCCYPRGSTNTMNSDSTQCLERHFNAIVAGTESDLD